MLWSEVALGHWAALRRAVTLDLPIVLGAVRTLLFQRPRGRYHRKRAQLILVAHWQYLRRRFGDCPAWVRELAADEARRAADRRARRGQDAFAGPGGG